MNFTLACLLLLGMISSASAQIKGGAVPTSPSHNPTIDLGGFALHLGMDRDPIIGHLQGAYKVTKIQGDDDSWMIGEKEDSALVGTLGFKAGKLTYASRRWAQGDEDAYHFAQALRAAMAQVEAEGSNACTFMVPTSRTPKAEWSYLEFYCGDKEIEIEMMDVLTGTGKGRYVSVDEVLRLENASR